MHEKHKTMKAEERNAHELEKKVMRSSHQVHLRDVCDLGIYKREKTREIEARIIF